MKRFSCGFLLFIFLFSPLSYPQESNKPHIDNLKPDSGNFTENIYTNEYFGFTYELGEGWFINEELTNGDSRHSINRLPGKFLLLIVDRHTGKPIRQRVLMLADDASQYNKPFASVKDYVERIVHAQTKAQGMELVRDAYAADYAERHFYRADYRENYGGGSVYKAFVSTELNGFLLSWTFAAGSPEELSELVNSLQRISFRHTANSAEQPVAPQATLPAPKRIRISQMALENYILQKHLPEYPEAARQNRVEGFVRLHIILTEAGEVKSLEVIDGDPLLTRAALDGVRRWKFKPFLLNGDSVEVDSQITVEFKLSKGSKRP